MAIHDGQGKPVLRATSEGPYMLVKLPAGDYKVSATYKGQTQERQVAVKGAGAARAVFEEMTPRRRAGLRPRAARRPAQTPVNRMAMVKPMLVAQTSERSAPQPATYMAR